MCVLNCHVTILQYSSQLLLPRFPRQLNVQGSPCYSSRRHAYDRNIVQRCRSLTGQLGLCQQSLDLLLWLCAAAIAWQTPAIILHTHTRSMFS